MSRTVAEVINWLWANNNSGGKDFDGIYGKQCVDLPKGLLQYCGIGSWNKARGNGIDVVNYWLNDGLATKQPTKQNRIRIVSVGPYPAPYGHVFIIVDQTVFEMNKTQAVSLASVKARGYSYWNEAYPTFIEADKGATVPNISTIGSKKGVVNASVLNVRNKPSTSGKVVAQYKKGQTINALKYHSIANGYVWYTYTSNSGATRYVAAGKNTGAVAKDDFILF